MHKFYSNMNGLFCGLLTIDLHFFTDHYPEENTKTKVRQFNSYIGGPVTNAAITFQHLGGNAHLVTAVGKNAFNPMVENEIKKYKVSMTDFRQEEPLEPIFASILTNKNSGTRTIFSYHPPKAKLINPEVNNQNYGIALFDGFYMDLAIIKARQCRDEGITTVLDGGSWKSGTEELLKYIDFVICSEDFLPPGVCNSTGVTSYLIDKGIAKVAITRGEKPMIVNEGEANMLLEVPKMEVVDTLGAGDILHGAFCYFYLQTDNFLESLRKAAQIASFSCSFPGPRAWMERK